MVFKWSAWRQGVHGVFRILNALTTHRCRSNRGRFTANTPIMVEGLLSSSTGSASALSRTSCSGDTTHTHTHSKRVSRWWKGGVLYLGGINGRYYPLTLGPHHNAIFATNRLQQPQYAPHCPNQYRASIGWYHTERMIVGIIGVGMVGMVGMVGIICMITTSSGSFCASRTMH